MKRRRARPSKKAVLQSRRVTYALALPVRGNAVARQWQTLEQVFRELFADENFLTLLEAESMTMVPEKFRALFEEVSREHEIRK